MSSEVLDKIKYIWLKNSKIIVVIFFVLLISFLLLLFVNSYALRNLNDFDEITKELKEIYAKDKGIYNNTNVDIVKETVKGIDVSSWQGEINWDSVASSEIDFVIIRCAFRNLSNEDILEDKYFRQNIEEANRLGIPVGVYFYSTAISKIEAIEEASFVLKLIKDYKITYPVVYDFELFNQKRTSGISDEIINENAISFLDYIENHGYHGLLYSNNINLRNHWYPETISKYPIWFAQYAQDNTLELEHHMWQYADNGRVPGIKGNVDLNESYYRYVEK